MKNGLIDGYDYAPEAKIVLPLKNSERLALLNQLVGEILSLQNVITIAICLTFDCQVEDVVELAYSDFLKRIIEDCKDGPPCRIYLLTK